MAWATWRHLAHLETEKTTGKGQTQSRAYQKMSSEEPQASFERVDDLPPTQQQGDSHTKSLIKGITWRILASLTTVLVSWFVVGDVATAFQIGFFEFILKVFIYYFHERLWVRIPL
jgi:uncharacterized membrane protein